MPPPLAYGCQVNATQPLAVSQATKHCAKSPAPKICDEDAPAVVSMPQDTTVLFAAGQEMDEPVGVIVVLELVVVEVRDDEGDELGIVVDDDGLDELVLELLVGAIGEDIVPLDVLMAVEVGDIMPLMLLRPLMLLMLLMLFMLLMPLMAESDIDD
ncbi:hypothetical protein LTR28_004184 [Elasticomyces elasticus]|nr:hypothetical protein LTR28_004184 [Elasticomyces elasticus]